EARPPLQDPHRRRPRGSVPEARWRRAGRSRAAALKPGRNRALGRLPRRRKAASPGKAAAAPKGCRSQATTGAPAALLRTSAHRPRGRSALSARGLAGWRFGFSSRSAAVAGNLQELAVKPEVAAQLRVEAKR